MLVSLEGLPGKACGSAKFEEEDQGTRGEGLSGLDWAEWTSFMNDTPEMLLFSAADH
jgi:hypothetical protein